MSALNEEEDNLPSDAIIRLHNDENVIMALAEVLFDRTDRYDVDVDWDDLEESKREFYADVIERILGELLVHVDRFVKAAEAGPTAA